MILVSNAPVPGERVRSCSMPAAFRATPTTPSSPPARSRSATSSNRDMRASSASGRAIATRQPSRASQQSGSARGGGRHPVHGAQRRRQRDGGRLPRRAGARAGTRLALRVRQPRPRRRRRRPAVFVRRRHCRSLRAHGRQRLFGPESHTPTPMRPPRRALKNYGGRISGSASLPSATAFVPISRAPKRLGIAAIFVASGIHREDAMGAPTFAGEARPAVLPRRRLTLLR